MAGKLKLNKELIDIVKEEVKKEEVKKQLTVKEYIEKNYLTIISCNAKKEVVTEGEKTKWVHSVETVCVLPDNSVELMKYVVKSKEDADRMVNTYRDMKGI